MHQNAVATCWALGIINGTGGGKFSPNQTTTRAMFVTVLGRIAGVDQNQYKNTCTFRDVKKDWAEPYIAWAAENKIVNALATTNSAPTTTSPASRPPLFCSTISRGTTR